ncbi:MAG: DUF805 domain-containing protein [Flavipsychrobacter sp.]|nr:DUF805 domain-containing protein [Flavipsychrobacter sp.]
MIRNIFSFNGRIRRRDYGITVVLYYVAYFIMFSLSDGQPGVLYLLLIPMIWIMLAQGTKRCHDIDRHGAYQLIPFYIFWMLFKEGDKYENAYGLNPKDPVQMSWDFEAQNFDNSQPGTFPPPIPGVVPVTDDDKA